MHSKCSPDPHRLFWWFLKGFKFMYFLPHWEHIYYTSSYVRGECVSLIVYWILSWKSNNCTWALLRLHIHLPDVFLMQRSLWKLYHIACICWYCALFVHVFLDLLFALICSRIDYICIVVQYYTLLSDYITKTGKRIALYRFYIDRLQTRCIIYTLLACELL